MNSTISSEKKSFTYKEYMEEFLQSKSDDENLVEPTPIELGTMLADRAINELREALEDLIVDRKAEIPNNQ